MLLLNGGPGLPCDYLLTPHLRLVERGWTVHSYDQLGCGQSDRPDDATLWTVERYVEELENVVRVLGLERFSLLSFVWGPGQATPVHDHTVWGYVGMLRGSEFSQRYRAASPGYAPDGPPAALQPGQIEVLSPAAGDIHRVWNAHADAVSISVHLYGGNIGAVARHVYDPDTGRVTPFVSGYSSAWLPNLWDRSAEVRQALGR